MDELVKAATNVVEDSLEPIGLHSYIVGIGSSAGGLEALTTLIQALPCNLGISYVVIQHLSPTHRSMLVQLLGRETQMAVQEVQDNIMPEPDIIYVAPATRNTILQDGRFHLLEAKRESLPKPSVNVFFSSLAAEKAEDAIGVVLSGTGSDGTVGLRTIKAHGGFTFAQEPDTAKYTGMPKSAIDSGCVDWVLPPEKIAAEIAVIMRSRPPKLVMSQNAEPQSAATRLKQLLIKVKQYSRIDFGGYKEATIWRRIERRMSANHLVEFEDYVTLTNTHPEELECLAKDILISVTAFFRDAEAFAKLKQVIEALVTKKIPGDEIRIWVPACATGEEAYSIAILLSEALGAEVTRYKIQIFATDIDTNAMNIARKGLYVEGALADIEPALILKYFSIVQDRYEINRLIRDMVVFARQDLVLDPPFLRLDLISCRNVLIYLQTELQSKTLATFHYALVEHGFLFLGKSEGVYQQEALFDVVDKNFRIYRRRSVEGKIPFRSSHMPILVDGVNTNQVKKLNAETVLLETALKVYVPASIMVDDHLDIQHIYGEVSEFVTIASGKPSTNLMHLLRRELRSDLQLLQHQAEQRLESAQGRPRSLLCGGVQKCIRLSVHPIENLLSTPYFLVSFEQLPEPAVTQGGNQVIDETNARLDARELEDELIMTRERLQTVIEELETSNEELQALNEEVQAANEELQSSNEELEATNEELQSTNEELSTVNEELQVCTNELAETLNELEKIQNSVGFPIIAVNEQLKVIRFNIPAAALFNLSRSAIGQHLSTLRLPGGMKSFLPQVQQSLDQSLIVEGTAPSLERHYFLHIAPYDTLQAGVKGAIITLVDDTERRAHEEEVAASREKLLSIMNNSTAVISLKDIAGRYEFVNHQFETLFNVDGKAIIGKTDAQILSAAIADDFRVKELEVLRKLQTIESEDHVVYGDVDVYMLSIRFPLMGADNLPYGICTQASDITARVQAESQLRLAARVFDRSSEAIVVTDAQKNILTVNDAFTNITGYCAEEVVGKPWAFLASNIQDKAFIEPILNNINSMGWWQGEVSNRRKNGDSYPEWLTLNAIHDQNGKTCNYVGIFSDISIVKESQQRIEFLATHDTLTELPNRLLFLDRVRQAVARGDRGGYLFAVLFVDLDDFKLVNDTLGHAAGDTLLKEVAKRMRHMVRQMDTVARFGGDEFALLIENTSVSEVEGTARRICAALGNSIHIGEQIAHVGASVGVAVFPHDSKDAETLLKHADTAMYEAKAKGKNAYQFFTRKMMEQADLRLRMENGLRQAIDDNTLYLHYQPQIDLATGQLIGVEALLRWRFGEQGAVSPAHFIPLAEKCGLIDKLGEWVVDATFAQLVAWRVKGYQMPNVSINVSLEQFKRGRVLPMLQRLLENYQLSASNIRLEITESTLSEDHQGCLESLLALKKLGFKISIDDFGTGYSSLARLKNFPIDELKIDRSFVDNITEITGQDRVIAQTIIAMSKTLGYSVVAEGVETSEQLDTLRLLECDIVQGYFISKPLPADELMPLLTKQALN